MVQMFYLALRHKMIDGDALGVLLYMPELVGAYGARNATMLQIVDPDRLSNPNQQPDTMNLRGGVEIDGLGCPIAYHIRRAYPSDWYGADERWRGIGSSAKPHGAGRSSCMTSIASAHRNIVACRS